MSKASTTRDDLTILQREVTELQESRKRIDSADTEESEKINNCEPVTEAVEEAVTPGDDEIGENTVHDIADQIEKYLKDFEETAMERPTLALLATFALGVVVGHYISRR